MADWILGIDPQTSHDLAAVGSELRGIAELVQARPAGELTSIPVHDLPAIRQYSPRSPWSRPDALLEWADSDAARRLLGDPVERRRFEAWEREVFLTAGMPTWWARSTARQLRQAWEFLAWALPPDGLRDFIEDVARQPASTPPSPVQHLQVNGLQFSWRGSWAAVRAWLTDDVLNSGSDDGQASMGGFAAGVINLVTSRFDGEGTFGSTVASAVIASPVCLQAFRDTAEFKDVWRAPGGPWYSPRLTPQSSIHLAEMSAAWAACLGAVITTWP